MMDFTGFTPETIDFLWQLRMNNHKAWMAENRERYQTLLKEPFDALSYQLYTRFTAEHPEFPVDYAVSRINRDVRFSKDKSPYKPRKWVVLKEPGTTAQQWKERPVLYFELMPEGYVCGMGFYDSKPQYMRALRKRIDAAPQIFARLAQDMAEHQEFVLYGDPYKRPMGTKEYQPVVMDWYQRKSLDLVTESGIDDLLFSADLIPAILQRWETMLPIYAFLRKTEIEV